MIALAVREALEAESAELSIPRFHDPGAYSDVVARIRSGILTPPIVNQIRFGLDTHGYVVVSTDLADYAPPTPTSLAESYAGPYLGEAVLALVGSVVGELQSLAHQNDGRVFHDIMPVHSFRDQQTSASSEVTLELHTELAFVADPPDYLMLFCVRQDPGREAETHLFDSRAAIDRLTAEEFAALAKHEFHFGLDANITGEVDAGGGPYPIFDAATARLLRYDLDLHRRTGREGDAAFRALTEAFLDARLAIRLRRGQLLLVDNKRMVHSRSRFRAD